MHLYVLTQMLRNADAVRVYSHPMHEIAQRYNSNVFLVKSYFDFSMLEGLTPQKHDKIRIVYSTSRGKNDTLAKIYLPAIARILEEFEDKVEFYAFGQIPDELKEFKNTFKLSYEPNYSRYIKSFYIKSYDIGLAPLLDDRFHNSKTNNKFREYGAMGVCGVYSDAQLYSDCVNNRENGMLVDNSTESWYNAIRDLVTDPGLREKIRKHAYDSVKKYYSIENTLADWESIIDSLTFTPTNFNNILSLNTGIIADGTYQYANPRLNTLLNVLGFCGVKYEVFDSNSLKKKELADLDILICFINNNKDVEFLADKLALYGIKNIIFDTMLPYETPQAYPHITFTNSDAGSAKNVFNIGMKGSFEQIDLLAYSNLRAFTEPEKYDYIKTYCSGIGKLKQYNEEYYSEDNDQCLWAELLSRYKGTYDGQATLASKARNRGKKIAKKISNRIKPLFKKFSSFFLRCQDFITLWGDYLKINFFKKY